MRGEHRFKEGDVLIVVDRPVLESDKMHSGKEVVLTSDGYNGNGDRIIYNADYTDGSMTHIIFYDEDLRHRGNRGKIAELKAELARLEAEDGNEQALDNIRTAPVGSNVFIKPTLYTKVGADKWRWFFVDGKIIQYHSHSGTTTVVNDVRAALETGTDWEFFPADKD